MSELYHANSALHESDHVLFGWIRAVGSSPDVRGVISHPFYPTAPDDLQLDAPEARGELDELLSARRSPMSFGGGPVDRATLGRILHRANGVTARRDDPDGSMWSLRAAPSGGGLYPIELCCFVLEGTDLPGGGYWYNPLTHALSSTPSAEPRSALSSATYLPVAVESCSVAIAMVAVFGRSTFKYGERAYRFVLLEAGHIAQNILLAATAEGLAALPVGGFLDADMNALVGVDGVSEAVVYLVLLGTPSSER